MRVLPKRGWFRSTNKYNARKVRVDGHTFDSINEAKRYGELLQYQEAGLIRDLKLQPKFVCEVNGVRVTTMKFDFDYEERQDDGNWRRVIEDVKSPATAANTAYRVRLRLVRALYPNEDIREVVR